MNVKLILLKTNNDAESSGFIVRAWSRSRALPAADEAGAQPGAEQQVAPNEARE